MIARALPVALAALAIAAGGPLYLALDRAHRLPLPLCDRPWPLELSCTALALASLVLALRSRRPRRALAAACLAVAATLGFSVGVRAWRPELPPAMRLSSPERLASAVLVDERGARATLRTLAGHPTVLAFFRGAYCPYCREQLGALGRVAAWAERGGVRIVAVSPDPPEAAAALRRELGLDLAVLSDPDEEAVTAACGTLSHCLLLLDATARVRWALATESWSALPAPETLVRAAYRLR